MATENELLPENLQPEEVSLRDELEAAFDKEPTDEVRAESTAKPENEAQASTSQQRDPQGRYTKAQQAAADAAAANENNQAETAKAAQAGNAAPPPQDPKDLKAPASWTPGAREEWGGLSPRVKQEIQKREWEAQKVVQESASARQFIGAFENVVRPFEMFIRAENSNPLQAVQNLMQTAASLRMGTPTAKADLLAGLVRQYAIDPVLLDRSLDLLLNGRGEGAAGFQGQQGQQFRDPRVDQLLAARQQDEQQREQRMQHEARSTLAKFAEGHEFYSDVASTMADIIDLRQKHGESADLEKAYQQACQMNDEVRSILAQRNSASASRSSGPSQAVLRAKRAASSVRGESSHDGATIPKDDSIRASIEAALENVGRV